MSLLYCHMVKWVWTAKLSEILWFDFMFMFIFCWHFNFYYLFHLLKFVNYPFILPLLRNKLGSFWCSFSCRSFYLFNFILPFVFICLVILKPRAEYCVKYKSKGNISLLTATHSRALWVRISNHSDNSMSRLKKNSNETVRYPKEK